MKLNMINKNIAKKINSDLSKIYTNGPNSLLQSYSYVISGEGKRVRPMLTILTSKSLYGDYKKSYQAALSIEILHNFTLIHDDIMDQDTMRHGQKTVHEKWDVPLAILSGDALLALSLKNLTNYGYEKDVLDAFNKGLLAVCEGQALDKEFEAENNISREQYFQMIEKKTSYLIAMSIQIGALCYKYPKNIIKKLFNFGILIGRAFQIQDDLLEITSNPKNMKKSLSSDIILSKKTYPTILCRDKNDNKFNDIIKKTDVITLIVSELRKFIIDYKIDKEINNEIKNIYSMAFESIKNIEFKSNDLLDFTKILMNRKR